MKARISYWNGKWWCRRLGITGCGSTPKEAWDDMWMLYREAVTPNFAKVSIFKVRQG